MVSKLICAAVLAASGASAHSIQARQAPQAQPQPEPYYKVNRDSEYGAPSAPSYSAPAPSYEAPAPSYSAPAAPSYSAPEPSYGAPATGYGYEEEAGLDLTSIIIPLLALVGLSLLFPTYVSLTTVRKRREAGDEPGKRVLEQDLSIICPSTLSFTDNTLVTLKQSITLHHTLLRNPITLQHYYVQQNSLRSCYDRWSGPWCPCPYPT
jgi:hypothetical protein